eukprot:2041280-Rhodomonas_salina.1
MGGGWTSRRGSYGLTWRYTLRLSPQNATQKVSAAHAVTAPPNHCMPAASSATLTPQIGNRVRVRTCRRRRGSSRTGRSA